VGEKAVGKKKGKSLKRVIRKGQRKKVAPCKTQRVAMFWVRIAGGGGKGGGGNGGKKKTGGGNWRVRKENYPCRTFVNGKKGMGTAKQPNKA